MGASRSAQSLAAGRKRLLGTELLSKASSGSTAVALSAGGWLALRPPEIVEPEPVTPRGQTIYAKESLMNRQVRSTWSSVPAKVVLAALLVVLPVARGSAGDIYVNQNATGANNGTSWANAYKDLQPALIAAVSGDTLRVAQGVYKPTAGYSRAPTFQLKNRVTLYGGYPTGGGTRNPAANVTTLSGDTGTVGDASDNSYHVVTGSGTDNTAVLDGFTITGGNASGGDPDDRGGGMYSKAGSPTVQNVIFTGNSATNDGGGMYGGDPRLTNVTFTSNSATNGGGMYDGCAVLGSGGTLTNVTFSGNSASSSGGGMYNKDNYSSLTNVTFSGNSAGKHGGGVYNDGSNPRVRNAVLWGNTPNQIGNLGGSAPVVTDSVVQGGYAAGTNIITADPKLGTLGYYGGYTQTIPLLAGSSAIDGANPAYAPTTDQRGVTRPQGVGDDIGAYESCSTAPPTLTSITPNNGANTGPVDITNLAGTGFVTGATVKLTKAGQGDIEGISVTVVSSTKITCRFDLSGAAAGPWNVVLTNPDTQGGTLANGFTVTAPG